MNKEAQIQFLADKCGLEKAQAEKVILHIGPMIRSALSADGTVNGEPSTEGSIKITGLGTFDVATTAARSGTNPQVSTAKKALANAEATAEEKAKAEEIMAKVASGELKETYEKPAGKKLRFKEESSITEWCGSEEEAE